MAGVPIGLLAAGGIAAGAGAAQAITGGRKSEFDKRNEAQLDRLLQLQNQGRLGLTPQERAVREQQLVTPVQRAATETRQRSEAAQAAAGSLTGSDLSRLRTEATRAVGEGAQNAALTLQQEDIRKEQAQRAELAQRDTLAEQRRLDRRAAVFSGISQAAGGAGAIAGAVPETLRAAGLAGAPIRDTLALKRQFDEMDIPLDLQQELFRIPPHRMTRVLENALMGNIVGPEEAAMDRVLRLQAGERLRQTTGLDASLLGQLAEAVNPTGLDAIDFGGVPATPATGLDASMLRKL